MYRETMFGVALIIVWASPTCSWEGRVTKTINYVVPVTWLDWTIHVVNQQLTDMSADMIRDAIYKLEVAYKIQARYRSDFTYQIGLLTNSMHNDFEKMILIYRDFSNLTLFRNVARETSPFMNAFHAIQALYNKIRFEKSLFTQMMKKKEEDNEKLLKLLKAKEPGHPMLHGFGPPAGPGGRKSNLNSQNINNQRNVTNTQVNYPNMTSASSYTIEYGSVMYPDKMYISPEAKTFLRPRISLGGHYSGPFQGLPAAKVTKQTTKKRLWQPKTPKY